MWDVIVGGRRGTGATSSDRLPADHPNGDRVSAALPAVCRVWGEDASVLASDDAGGGRFGPRVQATVGYLTGRIGASQREVQEILATLCQIEMSVGSITALEQAGSAALAAPVAEARKYAQRRTGRNAEATRWRGTTEPLWLR